MSKYHSESLIAIAFAGLTLSTSAQAQSTSDAEQVENEPARDEIIVTARRVEERLQDVPVAVTAFGGEGLRERQIESAADLMYNVPSLSVGPSVGGNSANYGLRGQRQGIGNAQGVVTYLTEVPVGASSTYRQTFDMASIQVLKGPQGTLFGANSNGGAILFVPQKPTDKFEGEIEVATGSYSLRDITGVLNVPLTEWANLRVAGNIVRRNGYTQNLNPCPRTYDPADPGNPPSALVISPFCGRTGAQDDDRHESWRVSLSLSPTDDLQNDTVYWGIHEDNIGGSWVPFRFGAAAVLYDNAGSFGYPTAAEALAEQLAWGNRKVYTDEQSHYFREDGVSNITTLDVGDLTFKNIYGYRSSTQTQNRDQDGSRLPFVQQDSYRGGRTNTHTDEFQILGTLLDNRIQFVAGGFLLREDDPGSRVFTFLNQITPIAGTPVNGRQPPARTKTKNEALFANVDVDLSFLAEGLRFSVGARYTWNNVKSSAPQNLVNGVCTETPTLVYSVDLATCTRIGELSDKGKNYSATLQYNILPDTMVYIATRHGFKPGGANNPGRVSDPNLLFFKPEKITDYELGLKSEFDIGAAQVRTNIAAYTSTYRDVQRSEVVQQALPLGPSPATFNAQKATIRGVEPEINVAFGRAVNLSLFYSYLDAKFDEYSVLGPGNILIDKSGTEFTAVSKHTLGSTLNVRIPVPARLGEASATANYYYRSSQTFADNNINVPADLTIPGYSVVNARVDWKVANSGLRFGVAVSNLFDKEYALGGADFTSSVGYANNIYGPPRMFRVEAGYKF